jgi:tetratricopeptide (TPR) repeat protein
MVGLTIMLAWGVPELLQKFLAGWPRRRTVVAAAAIGSCGLCVAMTAQQASYWQNDGTLFQHAIDVTEKNFIAQSGLGIYLAQTGHGPEAIPHFEEFLRIVPNDAKIHNNLGILYSGLGDHQKDAISHFEAAVRIDPTFKEAQYNLGVALSKEPGRTAEAIAHLDAARRIQPSQTVSDLIDRLRASQQ